MASLKTVRRKVQYELTYWFVRFLIWLSMLISRKRWLSFCGTLGVLGFHFASKTRALTTKHLGMAYPTHTGDEIRKMARSNFKMLGKNAGDILRSSRTVRSLSDIEKIIQVHGFENFEHAQSKGKGVIFVSCHIGAFDLQVTYMAMRGLNPNIIGTPLKNKKLNDLLWQYRNAHGAIAIERGRETFRMIKILKSGGLVALLIDQDTKVKSTFVQFFGIPAATPVGAAVLAMKTGASVVPTYIHMGKDGTQHMNILPEIEMKITGDEEADTIFNTQILTNFIEDQIRKHPDQWVWMHERWKTRPENERQL